MVSVVIPTYNREKTVVNSIISVLNQTYKDIEVIVIDDGSIDNTKNAVLSIEDDRVRYVYQNNSGACAARNHGIKESLGDYIAFHDSDDIWRPNKLEIQMNAMEKYSPDIIFCKLEKHYADGSIEVKPDDHTEGFVYPVKDVLGIGTQTLLGKRYVFEQFMFDEMMPRYQEFELLYRATKKCSLYCVDEQLVDYYVGEDSISSSPRKLLLACERIMEKYPELAKEFPIMGGKISNSLLNAARSLKNSGDPECRAYIKLALKYHISIRNLLRTAKILIY